MARTASTRPAGPGLSPAELGAWGGFLRAHAALVRALDAEIEREHGLALTTYDVLLHLARAPDGALRMSELADAVVISRSGLTRRVDRLARDGLLERRSCATDARGALAAITEEGRAALARARPTHLRGVREMFLRHFSQEELERMAAAWERILPERLDR